MADYIERDSVLAMATSVPGFFCDMVSVWDVVHLPSADVESVKHSRWILDSKNHCHCAQCNMGRDIETQIGWNYCPNCGARMEMKG